MILELEIAKQHNEKHAIPVRLVPDKIWNRLEILGRRKFIREELRALIEKGIDGANLVQVVVGIVNAELAVTGALPQFGVRPTYEHFALAFKEALQEAGKKIDSALLIQDPEHLGAAAAYLEIVLYGAVANLGIPYDNVLRYVAACYLADKDVDNAAVAQCLREAGLQVDDDQHKTAGA